MKGIDGMNMQVPESIPMEEGIENREVKQIAFHSTFPIPPPLFRFSLFEIRFSHPIHPFYPC